MIDDVGEQHLDARVVLHQATPVGVHATEERLVVQQLRRPFDRVDLRDLGGNDQAAELVELIGRDIAIPHDGARLGGIAQP